MSVTIHIPTPLRHYINGQDEVILDQSGSIQDVLKSLADQSDDLKKHLYDDKGELRKFVNIYLNDEDIRDLDGNSSQVKDGDEISIIPSIAGGL